jgi:hypothetical protein
VIGKLPEKLIPDLSPVMNNDGRNNKDIKDNELYRD